MLFHLIFRFFLSFFLRWELNCPDFVIKLFLLFPGTCGDFLCIDKRTDDAMSCACVCCLPRHQTRSRWNVDDDEYKNHGKTTSKNVHAFSKWASLSLSSIVCMLNEKCCAFTHSTTAPAASAAAKKLLKKCLLNKSLSEWMGERKNEMTMGLESRMS